jgi:AcrR family transcriptional regulator
MHQTEKRRLTRARLIEAALNVFAMNGYEHARVDDIASAAGLSKGAFYFNFSAKEDILLALFDLWADERTDRLNIAHASHDAPAEQLRAMLHALFSYAGGANWPALLIEFWSQGVRGGEITLRLKRVYPQWTRQLASAIQAAFGGGGDASPAAEEAARAMLATHDGLVTQVALGWPGSAAALSKRIGGVVGRSLAEAELAIIPKPTALPLDVSAAAG